MRYIDMPVGKVLRNPDDCTTYVKTQDDPGRDSWVRISDGWPSICTAIDLPPFLVELVEKPAAETVPVEYQWGVRYTDGFWSSCDWCYSEDHARDKAERTHGELVRRVVGKPEAVTS